MRVDLRKLGDGADNRSRTYDLRITNALLYQLSYIGPERPVTSVTTGQKVRSIRVMRQCPFESNGYFCITRDYLRTNRIVADANPLVGGQRFRPIGPRACSFCVLTATSAPRPNCPPSVKRVDAFTYTAEESTSFTKRSALRSVRVRMASEC